MRTVLMDLPYRVKGFVSMQDGEQIIILNARLNRESNQLTYLHEIKHIANRDLDQACDVNVIECIRHF